MTAPVTGRSAMGDRVASAALALVGTQFRLHGRDPAHGLDCIGLARCALEEAGLRATAPTGYRLRNTGIDSALETLAGCDLSAAELPIAPGDLLLVSTGPAQQHLVIAGPDHTFIHAHAGLCRVVTSPGPLPWPILHHWRPQKRD